MTRRLWNALVSLFWLAVFVVGWPWAMVAFLGWPFPRQWPDRRQWRAFLEQPITDGFLRGALTCLLWTLWAATMLLLGYAVLAAVRNTRMPPVRLAGPLQAIAAGLVGTIVVGLTSGASRGPAPAAAVATRTADEPGVAGTANEVTLVVADTHYTHRVRRGDTLWNIARDWLGDPSRWPEIYELNKGRHFPAVGGILRDPDLIYPGWTLRLPDDARPPQGSKPQPSTGTPPVPRPHREPPAVSRSTPPAASPSADAPGESRPDGVDLPGGWVGLPLAAAIAVAAATVAVRRRPRRDAVSEERPEVATVMTQVVRRHAPELLDRGGHQPTVAEFNADPDPSTLAPIGPDGLELAGLTDAAADGLGLAGGGAVAAARALLVATLSSGGPADPDALGHAIVTADILDTLFGDDAVLLGPTPRLIVSASTAEALTRVEEEIIARRRLLDRYETQNLGGMRDADPYHPPMVPLLLLAATPAEGLQTRAASTLNLGAPLGINGVLLGAWSSGRTLTVDIDGQVGEDGQRLAVIDRPTAIALLGMLREAHTVVPAGEQPTGDEDRPVLIAETEPPSTPPADGDLAVPVRVRLFGSSPSILRPDRTAVDRLRGNAQALLVYLAIHRDGARLADVMEAIWPDATVRRAAQRLSTDVANLRNRVREAARDQTVNPVVNTGGRYHLDPQVLDVDLWRLADAVARAATADNAEREALLRHAVAVSGETLAANVDGDWVEAAREQARRDGVAVRLQLAELLAESEPRQAADLAVAAARLDPYNESTARHAMVALARLGDGRAIRELVLRLRDALADIDEAPSHDLTTFAADLARGAKRTEPVRPLMDA
jgi:DNA-binding SARP family transcriptional activator/LysM repeat protein